MHRSIKSLPLRSKLFIGTSLGTLLVVAASSLILHWVLHASIERDIENHLTNSTESILNLVRTSVNMAIRNHLRAIAEKDRDIVAYYYEMSQQGLLSEEEAKTQATEVLLSQTIGQTGYVFCVDTQGIMHVHPNKTMRGADISDVPLNKIQRERKVGYVEYDWANPGESEPRAKALYMTYFAPWDWIISASSYRDEFLGLVRLEDFRESVLAHSFGETGYSFVMDYAGVMVIHPKLEGVNVLTAKDPMGNAFPVDILERSGGTITYDWINPGENQYRKKIAVFDSIPELGWTVASTGYLDEVERPLDLLSYVVAGTALVMVFLLFFMSWWVANLATRPLPSLMKAFDEGAHGNLSRRMDESLGGEFGQLAQYYNQFMDSLENSNARLVESEEKYRAIFEQAVEGMFQLLPEGRLVNINPAMARTFGYSTPEEMLTEASDITDLLYVDPTDRDDLYRKLLDRGKVIGAPIRLYRRDRSIFWAEVSERAVLDQNGDIILVEGILKDVTVQHDLMKKLAKAKEEAEAASQLKSNFLIMISHEMRTPLTSMLGFARMIKKQLMSKAAPALEPLDGNAAEIVRRAASNMDIIEAESSRLAKLVDNMMDFARLKAGKVVLCVKPIRPIDLITQAIESVSGIAKAKGLSIDTAVDENLPSVVADHERVLQVLMHLLNNAVEFTTTGGIELSANVHGDEIEFAVKDSGPGIPAESLDIIFDHFTQLGDVMTAKPQGSGMGLALCRSIIALHNGRTWAESEPGRGSVFRFTLPVAAG